MRAALLWLTAALLLSCSECHAQIATFGDSITAGSETPNAANYPQIVGIFKNQSVTNYAVAGAQAADQADEIYGLNGSTFKSAPVVTYMIGSGDERIYGADPNKLANFQTILAAEIYYLGSNVVRSTSTAWSCGAGWSANAPYAIGVVTHTTGSFCSVPFSGDVLAVGYVIQDGQGGQFTVTVDGNYKQTVTVSNGAAIATLKGRTYAPALVRIAGNGPGSHTAVFNVVSPTGQYVDIDWIWSGPASTVIFQGNILLETAAAYAASGGSVANTDTYNSTIQSVVAQAQADGINVTYIDAAANFNPATDSGIDGIHPTDLGQVKLSLPFFNQAGL